MLFSIVKIGVAALALFPDGGLATTRKHARSGRRELSSFPEVNRPLPELYGPEDVFYEAENLDYFKNEISPDWFVWLNPDEIEAGGTTCGFLLPDLGLLHDVTYPTIQVYVCVRFANVQPAAKGNMFVHCGGPGSLSSCTNSMIYGQYLSEKNLDDYNIWSIDQRGMGRSWPNFAHDECSLYKVIRDSTGAIQNMVYRDEDNAWVNVTGLDEEDQIKLMLQKYKSRASDCWGIPEFNMRATQSDDSVREFHFLENSGTRALAQDVHLLRHLMNAPKLHLYGISYGTSVFSTYATIYPAFVGLFVLDSNVSPNPDHYHIAYTKSVGLNNRINYVLYSCSAHNARRPGTCPVEDLRECVSDITAMLSDGGVNVGGGDGFEYIQIALYVLFQYRDRAEEVCALADAEDLQGFNEIMDELYFSINTEETTKQGVDPSYSQPTDSDSDVYDNPDYLILAGSGSIPITLVRAQDRAGAIYDEDFFAKEVLAFGKKYTGAGTGLPAKRFFSEYSLGFYWPKSAPIPPAGNPFLNGIIVGLLYDSATPYVWAQEMRVAFPYTNMLTSQATNHGLGGDDRECQSHVTDYLDSGYINFVDGLVCGDDFASADDFMNIFFPESSSTKSQTPVPSLLTSPPTETNEPTTQPTMAPGESKTSVPTSYVVGVDGEESAAPGESKTSVPTFAATLVPGNGSSNIFSHVDGLVTDDGDQNKPAGNNQTANAATPTNTAITSAPTPSTIAPTNGPTTADATMIKSGCTFRHHSCYHWLFHLGVTLVPLIFVFQ